MTSVKCSDVYKFTASAAGGTAVFLSIKTAAAAANVATVVGAGTVSNMKNLKNYNFSVALCLNGCGAARAADSHRNKNISFTFNFIL